METEVFICNPKFNVEEKREKVDENVTVKYKVQQTKKIYSK